MLDPRALSLPAKFTRFYPQQVNAIQHILTSPSRFIAPFAPTASGKTLIYFTSQILLGLPALVCVHTKALQAQIVNDGYTGVYSISGHRNYCPIGAQSEDDADDGGCPLRKQCRHRPEVEAAANSPVIVTNYHFALAIARSNDPGRLGPRPLLILDEAHGIHDTLTEQLSLTLSPSRIRQLLNLSLPDNTTDADIPVWVEWAEEAYTTAHSQILKLSEYSTSGPDIRRLTRLSQSLRRFLDNYESTPFVVKRVTDFNSASGTVQIKPVLAAKFAEQFLFRGASKVILTSASIDRRDMSDLGIADSLLDYFELPSVIHPSRRRVYYTPTSPPLALKHPISDGEIKVYANKVNEIVMSRLDRRGLIACQSYALGSRLMSEVSFKELAVTHTQSDGAAGAVERFLAAGTPSILVSPAVREGYDFPYNACNYGIILKIPFPDIKGNPELAVRCELDKNFRIRFASRQIEQMAGRIPRTPQDWSEIFILDAQWVWFARQADFHAYFRAAIVDWSGPGKNELPIPPVLDYITPAPPVEIIKPVIVRGMSGYL